MDELYREYLLEHYKNPKNKGKIEDAQIVKHESNPSCGDSITVYVQTQDGKISEIKFEGAGCVISMATASILTEELIGKTVEEVKTLNHEYILSLLGLKLTPTRLKCAMLALSTIQKGMEKK